MQEPDPARNLKLQAITRYVTNSTAEAGGASYHHFWDYLRAVVTRSELFWTLRLDLNPTRAERRSAWAGTPPRRDVKRLEGGCFRI